MSLKSLENAFLCQPLYIANVYSYVFYEWHIFFSATEIKINISFIAPT